jgi:hypothetical protein
MTRCLWPISPRIGNELAAYCKRAANHAGNHCWWSVLDGIASARPQHYVPGVMITFESELATEKVQRSPYFEIRVLPTYETPLTRVPKNDFLRQL